MKRVCKKKGNIILLDHGASNNYFIRKLQLWKRKKHYLKAGCDLFRNPEKLVRKTGLKINKIERKIFGVIYVIEARA